MSSPLLVVVLVAAGDTTDPGTNALTATAEDALGGNAIVLVREADAAKLSDAEADKLATAARADAVVVVTWSVPDRRRAVVRVHPSARDAWIDRTVSFALADPVVERGRTVGFEIASMLRVRAMEAAPANPAPAPKPIAPPPPPPPDAPVEPRRAPSFAIDAAALFATNGIGAEGAIRWWATERVAARIAGGWRTGELSAAGADLSIGRLGVGLAWKAMETNGPHPVSLGARVDVLALQHTAMRTDDPTSRGSRWLPGADFVVEASWVFAPGFAASAAPGAEVSFGSTRVFVDNERAASIPTVSFVGELGLRFAF